MRKLFAFIVLLFGLLNTQAAPIFIGTTLDYATNSGASAGDGTITFVFSNQVRLVYSRGGGSVSNIALNSMFLNFKSLDTNATIRTRYHFGNDGGQTFTWQEIRTTNHWYWQRLNADTTFPLMLTRVGMAIGMPSETVTNRGNFEVQAGELVYSNTVFSNLVVNLATNGSANTNWTVNYDQAVTSLTLTNGISLTNQVGLLSGYAKPITIIMTPTLVNRPAVYPTLGGASFGAFWKTNANAPLFTTLTNNFTYVLSLLPVGTNVFASMTVW